MRERKVSVHSLRSPGGGNQYNQAAIEEEYFHLIKKKQLPLYRGVILRLSDILYMSSNLGHSASPVQSCNLKQFKN